MSDERKPVICPWCGTEMRATAYGISDVNVPMLLCDKCGASGPVGKVSIPQPIIDENTSDGYHTFKELYHHRAVLFAALIAQMPDKAWKSKQHSDGTMFDGMFIVGIETPDGQATYHYDIDLYWGLFRCRELDHAPEWDGHTPAQAIERIALLAQRPTNRPLEFTSIKALPAGTAIWMYSRVEQNMFMVEAATIKLNNYKDPALLDFYQYKPTTADIEAARAKKSEGEQS
jgi:hypothetical protein